MTSYLTVIQTTSCPLCSAEPGESCQSANGWPLTGRVHAARKGDLIARVKDRVAADKAAGKRSVR